MSCPEQPVAVGTVEQSVEPGLTVPLPVAEPLVVPLVDVPLEVPVVDLDTAPVSPAFGEPVFAPPGVLVGALGLWLTEPPRLGRVEPLPVVPPDWLVAKAVAVLRMRTAAAVPFKRDVFMLVVSIGESLPRHFGEPSETNVIYCVRVPTIRCGLSANVTAELLRVIWQT